MRITLRYYLHTAVTAATSVYTGKTMESILYHSSDFLLLAGFLAYPEDGGSTFFRSASELPDYVAS
jgi:hypothetical protein